MSELHLKDLSKIYLEQIAEKKDDSYLETDMKKRQANNERARKEMEKIPGQKNPHFEAADMSGAPSIKDAKPAKKTNVKYDPHMKVMAPQVEKEEVEVDEGMTMKDFMTARKKRERSEKRKELSPTRRAGIHTPEKKPERDARRDAAYGETGHGGALRPKKVRKAKALGELGEAMSSYDRNRKRAAQRAAERNAARAAGKTGVVPGVGYVSPRKERETYVDSAGTTRHKSGAKMEALDPVGKEDGDVNNDGKKDSSDSYLMKRRAAIAKALGKKKQTEEVENPSKDLKGAVKKAVKRIDHNVSGDVDKNDKSMGNYGEFVPSADGKKKLTTKIGEGYSNWRTDLTEVMDDIESKPIKEKSVKNKVTINPKLSEAVEEIGGQVLEVTEVQEEASMSPQEIQLQKKKAMIDKMIATKRQQGLTKAKKSEEPAKAVGEEMSIKDQMRISQEYNRKSPEEKKAIYKKAVAGIPKGKPKKDTRTDAQKMTDATGPRPGSRYRGD